MITVYMFKNKNTEGAGKGETTYLNPEYSQTSYALLKKKKSPKELHMD